MTGAQPPDPAFGEHRATDYPDPGYPDPAHPGLAPPVPYPTRRRWPLIVAGLLAVALVASVTAALVFALGHRGSDTVPTAGAAKTAIQNYLNALSSGDTEKIARNTLCGMYEATTDRKSDLALADLSSDAFRKQFASVEVTTIDKIVVWSDHQSQVLFTMAAVPTGRERRPAAKEDDQAVAQLLTQDNDILVCSYLLRTGGSY